MTEKDTSKREAGVDGVVGDGDDEEPNAVWRVANRIGGYSPNADNSKRGWFGRHKLALLLTGLISVGGVSKCSYDHAVKQTFPIIPCHTVEKDNSESYMYFRDNFPRWKKSVSVKVRNGNIEFFKVRKIGCLDMLWYSLIDSGEAQSANLAHTDPSPICYNRMEAHFQTYDPTKGYDPDKDVLYFLENVKGRE